MNHEDLKIGKTYYLPVTIIYKVEGTQLAAILEEHPETADGEPFPPRVRLWDGRDVWLSDTVWKHLVAPEDINKRQI